MDSVSLVAVTDGEAEPDLAQLDRLSARLAGLFHVSVTVAETPMDARFAFTAERQQYYSTLILAALAGMPGVPGRRVLAVTPLDLYVPILTFVFGEAQLRGPAAIVSCHRLAEEFYGLPPDEDVLDARLFKEAVHELGHTLGLRHCDDWSCAMASTHTVELLDLKRPTLCGYCREVSGL